MTISEKSIVGIWLIALVAACTLGLSWVYHAAAADRFEMTQAETVKLIRDADNLASIRGAFNVASDAYNRDMAEVRAAHHWPDDLIFDGTEWKHAPKATAVPDKPTDPGVKK